jgi:DNA-binding response OmpR family regulator
MRLELNGFEVITADDGEEALARFRESRPDLVLLDLRMPRLDGYGVCSALKTDPATKGVPIIIFSASSSSSLALEKKCLDLGADDCIRKPHTPEELLAKIRRQLTLHSPPTCNE